MANKYITTITKKQFLEINTQDGIIKIALTDRHKSSTASFIIITDKRLEIETKEEENAVTVEN